MPQSTDFLRKKGLLGKRWDSPGFLVPPVVTTKVKNRTEKMCFAFPTTFEPFDVQIPHWHAFQSLAELLKSEKSPHQSHTEWSGRLTDVAAAWLLGPTGRTTANPLDDAPFLLCPFGLRPPSFPFWGGGLATKRVLSPPALSDGGIHLPRPGTDSLSLTVTHSWRTVQPGDKSLTDCSFFSRRRWGEWSMQWYRASLLSEPQREKERGRVQRAHLNT